MNISALGLGFLGAGDQAAVAAGLAAPMPSLAASALDADGENQTQKSASRTRVVRDCAQIIDKRAVVAQ
jgi:hypothetical protein